MKKKVLVTGGSGLVGNGVKRVSQAYQDQLEFIFVGSLDYDLTNTQKVEEMFTILQPNYVIHLAACVGGLFKNMNQKVEMLEKNLLLNYNIIHYSHKFGVEKLVACLSTCIFPDKVESYPIQEEMLHNGPPHSSNDAYAYAKRMIQIHCKAYRDTYGNNFVCVSPTNIYGPHDNFNLEDGHVLPSLIHKCFIAKKEGINFIVRGTGTPLRQFIYSNDVASLIIKVLLTEKTPDNIILSVSEQEEISIANVAKIIAKFFDYESRLEFDTSYSDGQYKKTVSNQKVLELFPDFKFVPVEQGIQQTIDWFVNNYLMSRK
jgi:GDP-L-fucose synthase